MNATKPDSAASTPKPSEALPGKRGERRGPASSKRAAVKPRPEHVEPAEIDFERHDTIPAPTWLDDGPEST